MTSHKGELAVVTGASSGIGLELARLCAADGYDLVIAADEAEIERAASELRSNGGRVDAVEADLATGEGFDRLMGAVGDRPVDALLANAGQGLGGAFLDQDFGAARKRGGAQRGGHHRPDPLRWDRACARGSGAASSSRARRRASCRARSRRSTTAPRRSSTASPWGFATSSRTRASLSPA